MFTQLKIYIMIGLTVLLFAAGGAAFLYYNWSQAEIKTLTANNLKLTSAVEIQKKTIKTIKADAKLAGQQVSNVSQDYEKARFENNKLRKKLSKHDIGFLAAKKPKLVTKIINKATANFGRCLEILSGAELTEKELQAVKPSQINSSCSDIANPNYKGR